MISYFEAYDLKLYYELAGLWVQLIGIILALNNFPCYVENKMK